MGLVDQRESRHQEVVNYYREFRAHQGVFCTTDYVLDETITLLFRRLPLNSAVDSVESIQEAIKQGYLILERITADRFERAIELRLKFQDKPRVSFTDLTSMAVM